MKRSSPGPRFSAVAGESITLGEVVAIKDSDGYAYAADADDSTLNNAVGIAGMSVSSGSNLEIMTGGVFSGWTGLSEGLPGYLSTTAGEITQTYSGTLNQKIGVAISTTEYGINIGPYDAKRRCGERDLGGVGGSGF